MKNIFRKSAAYSSAVLALFLGASHEGIGVLGKDQSAYVKSLDALPGWPEKTDFDMYSGSVKVGPEQTKSIHYFLAESQKDPENDPLIIWYNGGPGCSSMMGLLSEHGPYTMNETTWQFEKNNFAWNLEASVLYVEQPAGVGFSTCGKPEDCYHDDESSSVDNLQFLLNWYEKFPEFKKNQLYISGESYGGLYVPYMAMQIVNHNKEASETIPLRGFLVGNGVTNWSHDTLPTMMDQSYYRSVLDLETYDRIVAAGCNKNTYWSDWTRECYGLFEEFRNKQKDINIYNVYGRCEHEVQAYDQISDEVNFLQTPEIKIKHLSQASYTPWVTWSPDQKFEDILSTSRTPSSSSNSYETPPCLLGAPYIELMNDPRVRQQLNIPISQTKKWDICESRIGAFKYSMDPKGSQFIYEQLAASGSDLRILKYSGDNDLVVSTAGSMRWIQEMRVQGSWNETREWDFYHLSDNQVAGFFHEFNDGFFTFGTIHNAGHMVPLDQPERSYHFIFNWLFQRGEFEKKAESTSMVQNEAEQEL